jgi:mRNA interferase RelE/StbE
VSSAWRVEFDDRAARDLKSIGPAAEREVVRYLLKRIAGPADPRRFGKPLGRDLHGLWRWRVLDYRIIGEIQDGVLLVLVVRIGHRKDVYDF